jgi:uncharacterized lipoprotein YajG
MKHFQLLLCLGALTLLTAGCATQHPTAQSTAPTVATASAEASPDATCSQPGWTVVVPGDNL